MLHWPSKHASQRTPAGAQMRMGYEKCGLCMHCTRPLLRKGCLKPTVRAPAGAPEAAAATTSKLQAAVNYALRAERELHALVGGAWDGPGSSQHRTAWASRVRPRPCAPGCVLTTRPCVHSVPSWSTPTRPDCLQQVIWLQARAWLFLQRRPTVRECRSHTVLLLLV